MNDTACKHEIMKLKAEVRAGDSLLLLVFSNSLVDKCSLKAIMQVQGIFQKWKKK